jgi:hypothetical protein
MLRRSSKDVHAKYRCQFFSNLQVSVARCFGWGGSNPIGIFTPARGERAGVRGFTDPWRLRARLFAELARVHIEFREPDIRAFKSTTRRLS